MPLKKIKKINVTLGDALNAVTKGFTHNETRFQEIENKMVTRGEFLEFKEEVKKRFNNVDHAIESVKDDLSVTENVSVSNLQHRMVSAEKEIRSLNRRLPEVRRERI